MTNAHRLAYDAKERLMEPAELARKIAWAIRRERELRDELRPRFPPLEDEAAIRHAMRKIGACRRRLMQLRDSPPPAEPSTPTQPLLF